MQLDLHPHKFAEHPDTKKVVLVREVHYVQLKHDNQAVFLQQGCVFYESGPPLPMENWPEWLPSAIQLLSPLAIASVGFQDIVHSLNNTAEETEGLVRRQSRPPREFGKPKNTTQ